MTSEAQDHVYLFVWGGGGHKETRVPPIFEIKNTLIGLIYLSLPVHTASYYLQILEFQDMVNIRRGVNRMTIVIIYI